MADHWTRETIREALEGIGGHVEEPLTAYLGGGSALVVRGVKDTTPDIDLVVPSETALDRLEGAITDAGYSSILRQDTVDEIGSMRQFEDDHGRGIDIFDTQIGDGLVLSDGIERRSEAYLPREEFEVFLISPEDIYLSKMVHSGRIKDMPDKNALMRHDLDMAVISDELATQRELNDRDLPSLVMFGDSPEE